MCSITRSLHKPCQATMGLFFEVGMVYSIAWQESIGEGGLQESDPRRAVGSARPARAVPGLFWEVLHISEVSKKFVVLSNSLLVLFQQLACLHLSTLHVF